MCCQADLLITYIKYEWKWLSSFRSRFLSFADFDFIIVVLPVIERLFVLIKTCEQGSLRFTHSRFRLRPVPHFWRFIYSRLSQFSNFFFQCRNERNVKNFDTLPIRSENLSPSHKNTNLRKPVCELRFVHLLYWWRIFLCFFHIE